MRVDSVGSISLHRAEEDFCLKQGQAGKKANQGMLTIVVVVSIREEDDG